MQVRRASPLVAPRLQNPAVALAYLPVDGLLIPAWNQMSIEVHGHLNGAVAHLILHIDHTVEGTVG